ncbi:MAG: hypothetical protein QNJ51_03290 [Calothrix sp. MO_167.B12]|nr:hypothetical protein [Calothrix sp. MO_167.B12]
MIREKYLRGNKPLQTQRTQSQRRRECILIFTNDLGLLYNLIIINAINHYSFISLMLKGSCSAGILPASLQQGARRFLSAGSKPLFVSREQAAFCQQGASRFLSAGSETLPLQLFTYQNLWDKALPIFWKSLIS